MSDVSAKRIREVRLSVHPSSLGKHVSNPGLPFVRDHAEIPDAGDRVLWCRCAQSARLLRCGEEDSVLQLVLVLPPGHEDEVAVATVVDPEESEPVAINVDRGVRQCR